MARKHDMTRPPQVSVVVKAYNHAAYIGRTIESVLEQSFQDFELLITDDGSTDGTAEVAARYTDPRIDLQRLPDNEGISAAMNATVARARGAYVAILNSDDWAMPGRLERQAAFLDEHPDIAVVLGLPHTVDERGEPAANYVDYTPLLALPDFSRPVMLRHLFYAGSCLCSPTAMVRRTAYERVGRYDPRLWVLQDHDMWIRILAAGFDMHVLPEELTAFRVRDGAQNMSAPRQDNVLRSQFELVQILARFAALDAETFERTFGPDLAARRIEAGSQSEAIALLALDLPDPAYRLFGLQTLFDQATTRTDVLRLKELTGTIDLFGLAAVPHDEEVRTLAEALARTPDGVDALARLFDVAFYLAMNQDVAAAIAAGTMDSAFGHWLSHGIAESRRFRLRKGT